MPQTWKYMNQQLDPNELPTMQELISEIDANGGTDAALAELREKQYRQHCCELIWRYPISQGDSADVLEAADVEYWIISPMKLSRRALSR